MDLTHMQRALRLAERGRGRVEPNPVVGAVVVDPQGTVVGEGWHRRYGGPHAEPDALAAAGAKARGATIYVTLVPCNHHGKTPPCVDALLAAGVARVVYALADPNPVAAGGAARLAAAGVRVEGGLLAHEAARQNAPFVKRVRQGLPFVTSKWAMTLDGRIATASGDARWISSGPARRWAHERRDASDAVLVGVGTVLADDPALTTRLEDFARLQDSAAEDSAAEGAPFDARTAGAGSTPERQPLRVIVDALARTPLTATLVRDARRYEGAPVLLACTEAAPLERRRALAEAGVEVLALGAGPAVNLEALLRALAARRDRPVTNLLVEGGARIHAALLEGGHVDRVAVVIAPKIIGGASAPGPVAGQGRDRMAQALALSHVRTRSLGPDTLLEGDLSEVAAGGAALPLGGARSSSVSSSQRAGGTREGHG